MRQIVTLRWNRRAGQPLVEIVLISRSIVLFRSLRRPNQSEIEKQKPRATLSALSDKRFESVARKNAPALVPRAHFKILFFFFFIVAHIHCPREIATIKRMLLKRHLLLSVLHTLTKFSVQSRFCYFIRFYMPGIAKLKLFVELVLKCIVEPITDGSKPGALLSILPKARSPLCAKTFMAQDGPQEPATPQSIKLSA